VVGGADFVGRADGAAGAAVRLACGEIDARGAAGDVARGERRGARAGLAGRAFAFVAGGARRRGAGAAVIGVGAEIEAGRSAEGHVRQARARARGAILVVSTGLSAGAAVVRVALQVDGACVGRVRAAVLRKQIEDGVAARRQREQSEGESHRRRRREKTPAMMGMNASIAYIERGGGASLRAVFSLSFIVPVFTSSPIELMLQSPSTAP